MESSLKETYLIIDSDSLIYSSVTCSKEEDPECYVRDIGVAISKFDEKFQQIVVGLWEDYSVDITHYIFLVSGSNNFRKVLFQDYKSKRPPSPPLRGFLTSYVESKYGGFRAVGCEADDVVVALHKKMRESGLECVVATNDKDLKQISCRFFDYYYQRMSLSDISEDEARFNFWSQVLIGDGGDGVLGLKGYGKAKPPKIFKGCKTDFSYLRASYREYLKVYKSKARQKLTKTFTLVKLYDNVETPDINDFNQL